MNIKRLKYKFSKKIQPIVTGLSTFNTDEEEIEKLYRISLISGGPTMVGKAELENVSFNKMQGRVKPCWLTSVYLIMKSRAT